MYRGDNKTAQLSQRMIADAMIRLLRTNAFAEIHVSMLCREAQVSRQTFYSLFGTRENVLAFLLQTSCCFEPEKKQPVCTSADFRSFCQGYSRYILEKKDILELLVRNDMMHCLYDVQYASLMDCGHFMQGVQGDDRIYLMDFIASGMNSIAKNFVITGGHADEQALEHLMYRLFGGLYFIGHGRSGDAAEGGACQRQYPPAEGLQQDRLAVDDV